MILIGSESDSECVSISAGFVTSGVATQASPSPVAVVASGWVGTTVAAISIHTGKAVGLMTWVVATQASPSPGMVAAGGWEGAAVLAVLAFALASSSSLS